MITFGIFILIFLTIDYSTAESDIKIYEFSRNESLSIQGKRLVGHVIEEFSTKKQIIHCAYECLKSSRCRSFNYEYTGRTCQLNDADHETHTDSLVPEVNGTSSVYSLREAFKIDQEALGPCALDPCENGGRCLDTVNSRMERTFFCLCTEDFTGTHCELPKGRIDWDEWQDWGVCSVSCETGWTTRHRRCMDTLTGETLPAHKCYGRDVEYRACTLQACPRWEDWSEWNTCSTSDTCGRGVMHRYRNCSNGGAAGKDRFCLGFTNETAPCWGIDCRGMLLVKDGEQHGDGRLEILNDIDDVTMSVCADVNWTTTEADIVCKQIGFEGSSDELPFYNASVLTPGDRVYKVMCSGSERSVQACRREPVDECGTLAGIQCRVRGGWALWSGWGECSVTCENGTRMRTRDCAHPPPNNGGTPCPGENTQNKPCSLPMCPIDGVWVTWSPWSACDVTCENGTRFRTRTCTGPFYGGAKCPGPDEDIEDCFPRMCPVDGVWNAWMAWSSCSHTCGYGTRDRSRTCDGPYFDGADCPGSSDDTESCNTFSCPVDGEWFPWTEWGECSVECNGGLRNRTRDCNEPLHGGSTCDGPSMEAEPCNEHNCPIDGIFSEWTAWSNCSVTCANGTRFRTRDCFGPYFGGADCVGPLNDEEICVTASCPVDGEWQDWTAWENCNVTCGGGGQTRERTCSGPYFGGTPCPGEAVDWSACNMHECPVDGEWDVWSTWETCNVTCGGGTQRRTRACVAPQHGGSDCVGEPEERQDCNTLDCPVDGQWATWLEWSSCNATCGGGITTRMRTCHMPQHGGDNCTGSDSETMTCSNHECPEDGVWEAWSNWTQCTHTCGPHGTQVRNRTCTGPFFGGANCSGDFDESRSCNSDPCPIDGLFEEWAQWTPCSVSCGRGTTFRNRTCFGPYHGGKPCEGPDSETENCYPSNCPVPGLWRDWSEWTECSTSCENGTRTRDRECDGPYFGGLDCQGPGDEVEDCFLRWCPVDGNWTDWTEWDECSVTCGGSLQNRTRICVGPFHGGENCTGDAEETQECNPKPCPVDGDWSLWSKWSTCNVTCAGGKSMRSRYCSETAHGGFNCTGDSEQFKDCNTQACPVDGEWASWGAWAACDVTCGGGERWRERHCTGPFHGGADCEGPDMDNSTCKTHECPEDGYWDTWLEWGACNVSCGGGTRWRYRSCVGPFYGGRDCEGSDMSDEECNSHECPRDGFWREWSDWDECSVTCAGGSQSRYRDCEGPYFDGANCTGNDTDTRNCNEHNCPEDGYPSQWSEFYTCNVSCGGGIQWRNRTCIGPFYGGANCKEDMEDWRECSTHNCPEDGFYLEWSAWEACDVTCNGGIQWRSRVCEGPYYGGAHCVGPDRDNQTCNTQNCPIDGVWKDWTVWDECLVTCGGSNHTRYRTCNGPFHGGANCVGDESETRECNTQNCPVDGVFTEWGSWFSCNVTCGGGIQWRNRTCFGPFDGGADCSGAYEDSQDCNMQPCPVDGIWEEWTTWGECSRTCGGGQKLRNRTCTGPFHGGADCPGSDVDSETCSNDPCPIPGLWTVWAEWSLCTVTCGGGVHYRNRTCNMTAFGDLTTDCEGETEEIGDCHTYDCLPLAIHCADWATRGLKQSCIADVDPDGDEAMFGPVQVECDFDTEPGKAVTVLHHDQENITQVQGYEGAGEYEVQLNYYTGWYEAIKIVDSSEECAQFMKWDCLAAVIHNPFDQDSLTTFWTNRTEQMTNYFGGATPGSGNCACGETGTCFNASLPCNCDINDEVWRFDEGWVTNKAELPIHSFFAGDTVESTVTEENMKGSPNEGGIQTLGPLLCSGNAPTSSP